MNMIVLAIMMAVTVEGLDPTAYAGVPNAVGEYGAAQPSVWDTDGPFVITATGQDKAALRALCEQKNLPVTAG